MFDDYIKSLDNNNDSTNKQIIPAFEYICSQYQQFRHDLELLKEKQIITQNADGYLSWNKSKKSLAEYFAYLACGDTNHQIEKKERIGWKTIENVFRKTGLKNTLSSAKQYDKRSRDFECILEVLAKK